MGGDEWVEAAMLDDSMVVELLIRLHQLVPPAKIPVVPLEWGMRQPRSRQVLRCNTIPVKKEGESARASPTTPLSWSGGTSVSGGAGDAGCGGSGGGGVFGDCYEECSRPVKRPTSVRSKVATGSGEITNRRTRKKKTFAELKEEECLLLKENICLKIEVAKFQAACEEERARNNTLKRTKIQSMEQSGANDVMKETTCDQSCDSENEGTPTILLASGVCCEPDETAACPSPASDLSDTSEVPSEAVNSKNSIVLPDLNLPLEEGSGPEDFYGMS